MEEGIHHMGQVMFGLLKILRLNQVIWWIGFGIYKLHLGALGYPFCKQSLLVQLNGMEKVSRLINQQKEDSSTYLMSQEHITGPLFLL